MPAALYQANAPATKLYVVLRTEARDPFSATTVELEDQSGQRVRSISSTTEWFGEEALQAPHTSMFNARVSSSAVIVRPESELTGGSGDEPEEGQGDAVAWLGELPLTKLEPVTVAELAAFYAPVTTHTRALALLGTVPETAALSHQDRLFLARSMGLVRGVVWLRVCPVRVVVCL